LYQQVSAAQQIGFLNETNEIWGVRGGIKGVPQRYQFGHAQGDRGLYAAQQKGINRKTKFCIFDVCVQDFNSNFEIHIRNKSVFTRKTQVCCHNS
jgi:hypothetical protein